MFPQFIRMIPFLTYPLALLALATLPALAAIYILRNRYRRRHVSSLVLWQFAIQSKAGGAKVHRLQLPLLFFLELLALLLLVVAATAPQWRLPQSARPLIVILDDSISMQAADGGVAAQARARDFLQKLFQRPPPSARFILAGTQPRLLGAPVKSWREADGLLAQWNCWASAAALESALALASELGRKQADILVLTDHAPPDENISNPRLEWHSFGQPLENFAFVNATRTAFGDQDRCLLEIANFSPAARVTRLRVQTGTNSGVQSLTAALAPRERQRFVFNIPAATPFLRAALEPDALAADNEVQLLPPVRQRVRVQVALTNETLSALANRTLEATGLRAALTENPELIIHQSDTVSGSNAWSLNWQSPAKPAAFTGPFMVDNTHPLAEGISLAGVVWAGAEMTNSSSELPVILAGNTPLLSVREDVVRRKHLLLNLNPAFSTLPNTPDWPILFWNILRWRAAEMPGLKESNARLGAEVRLKTGGEPASVTLPGGTVKTFPPSAEDLALETPLPGIYFVKLGAATNRFAVNALAAEESDLAPCKSGQWGSWGKDDVRQVQSASLAWLFALAALGLLVTHLWLLAGGKGGR